MENYNRYMGKEGKFILKVEREHSISNYIVLFQICMIQKAPLTILKVAIHR